MALYTYYALSRDGKRVKGQLDAASVQHVREQIARLGLYPISIHLVQSAAAAAPNSLWARLTEKPVPLKDKILFTKQLGVLLRSGVALLQALELLAEQFEGNFKNMIITLKDGIKEGQSLATGLARYPSTFDKIYVQLVRAGEATGKLEVILDRLTTFLERREIVAKKVGSALRGPLIQLAMILGIACFLAVAVVPKIGESLAKGGVELPTLTRIMMAIASIFTDHYVALFVGVVALIVAIQALLSTEGGRLMKDRLMLRLPLIKYFTRMNAIVQFCSTLGMLLESGVNLPEALDIVCNIVDNSVLATSLRAARDRIIKEGRITTYLQQTGIFPPMAIYLINTGEQSGKLDYMLLTVAKNYEDELMDLSDKLSEQIQPVMQILTALVVGSIVFSIIMPLMQMNNMASQSIR